MINIVLKIHILHISLYLALSSRDYKRKFKEIKIDSKNKICQFYLFSRCSIQNVGTHKIICVKRI